MESAKRLYVEVLKDSNKRKIYDFFFTIPIIQQQMSWKNKQMSEDARKKGNVLFVNKPHSAEQHKAILELYNESIAHALPESEELAFAYGNRSALFIHLNKYKESIEDTERALRITQSSSLKVKLFCRKAQALKELGSNEGQHALLKAKHFLRNVSENDDSKKTLIDMVHKTKAMLKIEANNLVSDRSEVSSIERIRMLQINDKNNMFESVSVDYNEKYGRFLIANRDFSPGEIIFSEEFYATTLNSRKQYSYCDNCVKPCWVLIPCNYCTWAMYCSEKCKREAYENYHYVECTLISHIKRNEIMKIIGRPSIRLILMAIKEAGSIETLMAELKKVDNETDASSKEFFTKKNFERKFTAVYRLQCFIYPTEVDEAVVALSIILIRLLYRSIIKITSVEDMLKNEDVIFIGTLLLKFFKLRLLNNFTIETAVDSNCDHLNLHLNNYCKKIGSGLCLIGSLINHSCLPNISQALLDNKSLIFFALQPIKAGSPLLNTYKASYYELSKDERLKSLRKYQFICNCDACKNNLPTYSMAEMDIAMHTYLREMDSNGKISTRMLEIESYIEKYLIKDNTDNNEIQEDPQIIKEISSCMEKVFKKCPLNSKAACQLYFILIMAYRQLFDINKINYLKCS